MKRLFLALILCFICLPLSTPQKVEYKPPEAWRCMAWVVHDESRGEPLRGARAVLDVVLWRMKKTGKSACEIVAQPKQFSGYKGERVLYELSDEALARFVRVAKMKPVAVQCTHFHAVYVRPAWATKMTRCYQIGRHVFYKERKHAKG